MIRRETDATLVNRIANSDGVYSAISRKSGAMDWSPAVDGCVILSNGESAVGVFEETAPGEYQAHTMYSKECRGADALREGADMLEWMFSNGADIVWGATPVANRAARWFNRRCGAKAIGRDNYEADGEVEIFAVRKEEWSHP